MSIVQHTLQMQQNSLCQCILCIFPSLCGPVIVWIPVQNWVRIGKDWYGGEVGSARLSPLLCLLTLYLTLCFGVQLLPLCLQETFGSV